MSTPMNKQYQDLLLIIAWDIWIDWNKPIFNERFMCPEVVAINIINIFSFYPQVKDMPSFPMVHNVLINKAIPWAFFDDISQQNQAICGRGAILHFSYSH